MAKVSKYAMVFRIIMYTKALIMKVWWKFMVLYLVARAAAYLGPITTSLPSNMVHYSSYR